MWTAIKLRKAQTANHDFAVMDLVKAMESGDLHGKRRSHHSGESEHLLPPFEENFFVWFYSFAASDPEAREAKNYPLDDWAFYLWRPDLDRLFFGEAQTDHDDVPKEEPSQPIERAKAVLRYLYSRAKMPYFLKEAAAAVEAKCEEWSWQLVSPDTVRRAAAQLGYRTPRRR